MKARPDHDSFRRDNIPVILKVTLSPYLWL